MAEIIDTERFALSDIQQLYALNFAANAVGGRTGTQDALENVFENMLRPILFALGWKLAWGPKVFKTDPKNPQTPPTNAWFAATKGGKAVLAIAGTAPKSWSGWMLDFDVIHTVRWDKWVSKWPTQGEIPAPQTDQADDSFPTIAHGTAQGVRNILTNKSTKNASGTYVQDFLKKQPAGTEIYIVGHSMGGALSPTVALGLVDSGMITDKRVRVVASAGASPGNEKFAQQWRSRFADANLYNTKDVVPQAWQVLAGKDRCFPNIYNIIFKDQKTSVLKLITTTTQKLGEETSSNSGITYVPVLGEPFTSGISIPIMDDPKDLADLERQLFPIIHAQHVTAYLKKLGLENIIREVEMRLDDSDDIGRLHPEPTDGVEDE